VTYLVDASSVQNGPADTGQALDVGWGGELFCFLDNNQTCFHMVNRGEIDIPPTLPWWLFRWQVA